MKELLKTLAVVTEVMGLDWSEAAIEMIAQELHAYPMQDVQRALRRCMKECKGKLTLNDILNRLPGGHPGAEEAWAIVSRAMGNEHITLVWTDEMREAYGSASALAEDSVAARMCFKEVYMRLVSESQDAARPPTWMVTLGWDKAGREAALVEAVKEGRLSIAYVQKFLGGMDDPGSAQFLQQFFPRLLE